MSKTNLIVTIAACLGVLLAAGDAHACSFGAPAANNGGLEAVCVGMRLNRPASVFPVNLASELRVIVESFGGAPAVDIDTITPPTVWVDTGTGYEPAEFELTDGEALVDNARNLVLTDPVPGQYFVAWAEHTCGGQMPPVGEGLVVGEFEMTAAAAFPGSLGEARIVSSEIVTETVSRGLDNDCNEINATEVAQVIEVEVELDPLMDPWIESLRRSVEVDGEVLIGFGPPDIADGKLRHTIRHLCGASDDSAAQNELIQGEHDVVVIGQLGQTFIDSTTASFEIDCTDAPEAVDPNEPGAKSSSDSGCATAAGSPASPFVLLGLLAFTLRLRRRRLTRRA